MTGIAVSGLEKRWGDMVALAGIDFEARAGELLVLLGPSGCGKSTMLRIIAGLEAASAGSISFDGRNIDALPASQRGISMVFQSYALYPHLSVRENILFGLKVRRVAKEERERRLMHAAGLLGIGGLLERKPAQLSGGQKQRVALGRAIVAETSICLMDEPLSNLDAQLRQEMRTEIRALQQRLRMTMIYVTHDQVEAMTMADQIILLKDGQVQQRGSAQELYSRPRTSFVARFIGTPPMGLLRLNEAPIRQALAAAAGLPGLPATPAGSDEMLLGLRPESIRLADAGLPASVIAVEYLGADSILLCEAAGQRLSVRAAGICGVAVRTNVHLTWDAADQHLFDIRGRRINTAVPVRPA